MAAICSVARADQLETENATLRQLVTEERILTQKAQEAQEALQRRNQEQHEELLKLRHELTVAKARKPRRSPPTQGSSASKPPQRGK